MMAVRRWVERTFELDLPVERFPELVERLRGAPARLEEKLRPLARETLIARDGDKWSLQEQAGHLLDLDALHEGRLDDYAAGAAVLRAADMENRKTWEADHNRRPIEEILRDFRAERERFVARLEALDDAAVARSALHPRLQKPMRILDLAFFVAEHDDHHLAVMSEMILRRGARRA